MKLRSMVLPFTACAAFVLATTTAFAAGPGDPPPPPAAGQPPPAAGQPPPAAGQPPPAEGQPPPEALPPPPPPPGAGPPPGYGYPPPPPPKRLDGPRFRGGTALEAGAMIAPGVLALGTAGLQGQIGVQINDLVGVYLVPAFDVVFGKLGGVNLASAIIVDFTLVGDLITVGGGPDVGAFAAFGFKATPGEPSIAGAGGALYGVRLHFSVNPVVGRAEGSVRRRALAIGVDVRLLGGGAALGEVDRGTASAKLSRFAIAPQLTIGYQAF